MIFAIEQLQNPGSPPNPWKTLRAATPSLVGPHVQF